MKKALNLVLWLFPDKEANKEQPVIINIFIVGDELIKELESNE